MTAEQLAESLRDSKVGKLQSVEHFESACDAFCAVCFVPCFSVSILVCSVYFSAAENAALILENDVSAAETVSLAAAGTPALAAGNWAEAAWAEFETENGVESSGLHNMRHPGILDPRHFFLARHFLTI